MPLGAYMMGCVVRVIGDVETTPGTWRRRPIGTAFCVQVPSEIHAGRWYSYVLTAHHVIDAQPTPELAFPDSRQPGVLSDPVETDGPDWIQPDELVDLAALPYERPADAWITTLQVGWQLFDALPGDALLGMPFYYVGLLEPLDRAMARSGTLGAVYQEGIRHGGGYEYEAHLADCRSYGGFSGSPCFVEITMPGLTPREPVVPAPAETGPMGRLQYVHLLCGMVAWHLESTRQGPEASVYGVVALVTSDEIYRCLMSPELVGHRHKLDADPSAGSTGGVTLSAEPGAWQRFSEGESQ